jgi:UDP-N-acetylmuramate--alanine ligase
MSDTSRHRRQPLFGRMRHVHMVGIGGIGMSSIAEVLLHRGYRISGSDLSESDVTEHLAELGAVIHTGHRAGQERGASVVVHSSAVDPDSNPETRAARDAGIPVIARSEMLGELMRMKFGVGIAGTHGKTTTTTMAAHVISAGDFDPTVIVGGKVAAFGSNAISGGGDIILIEADEYDRTFLRLTPAIAVVTTIDADHLDCYRDLDDIRDAFVQYASSVPFFGAAILCWNEPEVRSIRERIDRRVVTYGTREDADVRAVDIEQEGRIMRFTVVQTGRELGRISLSAPGRHNVLNALAAITVGLELDMDFQAVRRGIEAFEGVDRRMHEITEAAGRLVVDDYAHHPTEVRASLEAARGCWPDRRILAVFQPHLYSRTRQLIDDFGTCFDAADVLVCMDIYPAREAPEPGVTGALVADAARASGHSAVTYEPDKSLLVDRVIGMSRPGDVIMTLGAGDIWRLNREMARAVEALETEAEVHHGR